MLTYGRTDGVDCDVYENLGGLIHLYMKLGIQIGGRLSDGATNISRVLPENRQKRTSGTKGLFCVCVCVCVRIRVYVRWPTITQHSPMDSGPPLEFVDQVRSTDEQR